ncbi:hypothetical protein MMC13_004485 [Lambiella insularis]|nr:hypothetical protein [Lambiella insularis]
MDHLPFSRSTDSTRSQLAIPRLSTEKFNDKYLIDYPDAIARKYEEEWYKKLETGVLLESMPSLQTWLFFGLLGTVFRRSSRKTWKDFSREATESAEATVTTEALVGYTIDYLKGELFTLSHQKHVCCCLQKAYDVLNSICGTNFGSSTCSQVVLSLSILGEYLSIVMAWHFVDSIQLPPKLLRAWPAGRLSNSHFLSWRMQTDGWCRKDIARQMQNLTTSGMYYVSRFGNPDASIAHESCTFTLCDAARVPDNSYHTKHVCENGNCGMAIAKQCQLDSILRKGDLIPLISPINDDTESAHDSYIELIERSPSSIYVAISHIWSEGLGNESDNSLPRCQLVRLSRYVKELYSPEIACRVLFWIDSICCPRKPRDLRGLAISKMRDTYARADKVLVLDSWLQAQEIGRYSEYDLGLKVFASKWSKRLWTLQEGALAAKLVFRFRSASFSYKDDFYGDDISSLRFQLPLARTDLEQVTIRAACTVAYRILRGYQLRIGGKERDNRQTLSILRGLKHRDTSHDEDEGLCLGALFNLDLEKIFEKKSAEGRMATFWKLLPDIPPSLIFSFAPRLQEKGLRWAPAQLRWSTSAFFDDHIKNDRPAAKLYNSSEANGLLVEYPVVLLHCPKRPLSHTFYFKSKKWYRVSCNTFYITRMQEYGMSNPQPIEDSKDEIDWCREDELFVKAEGVGILLSVDLPEVDPLFDYRAILVSIQGEENGMLLVKYESTISITPVVELPPRLQNTQLDGDIVEIIESTIIKERHQKWCLS